MGLSFLEMVAQRVCVAMTFFPAEQGSLAKIRPRNSWHAWNAIFATLYDVLHVLILYSRAHRRKFLTYVMMSGVACEASCDRLRL